MDWTPPSNADFRSYFARDFNFAPTGDPNNLDYITDTDITKAIAEGVANFNHCLFGSNALVIFMYLAAHMLVCNLQNSSKGISSQSKFPISSTSVGGVSVTYQIPDRYMKDAYIQQFAKTGYGMKYLEFALPYTVGVTSAAPRMTSPM